MLFISSENANNQSLKPIGLTQRSAPTLTIPQKNVGAMLCHRPQCFHNVAESFSFHSFPLHITRWRSKDLLYIFLSFFSQTGGDNLCCRIEKPEPDLSQVLAFLTTNNQSHKTNRADAEVGPYTHDIAIIS